MGHGNSWVLLCGRWGAFGIVWWGRPLPWDVTCHVDVGWVFFQLITSVVNLFANMSFAHTLIDSCFLKHSSIRDVGSKERLQIIKSKVFYLNQQGHHKYLTYLVGKNDGGRKTRRSRLWWEVVHYVFIRIRDFHVTLSHEATTQPLKVMKDHLLP